MAWPKKRKLSHLLPSVLQIYIAVENKSKISYIYPNTTELNFQLISLLVKKLKIGRQKSKQGLSILCITVHSSYSCLAH